MPSRGFIIKLAGLCVFLTLPLWVTLALKWPIYTDFLFYSTILRSFSAQLWAGELYPRWLTDTNGGFGSPVFLFYPPLAYYAMSLFQWLSPIDPHGFGRLIIGLTLGLFIAGLTSYRWLIHHLPKAQAELGALLYASYPSLIYICYHGFSFAQVWGSALAPLLIASAYDIVQHKKMALPQFAACYTLLTLTHPLSAMVFGCIPCLYVVYFSEAKVRLRSTVASIAAAALGTAGAAYFLIPAIVNKPYVVFQNFVNRFDYAGSLFGTFTLIPACVITATLAGIYIELPKPRRAFSRQQRFWLTILLGMIFMTSPLSKPLWDTITPLQFLQGGWRLVPLMVPAVVFLAASWLPYAKSRWICAIISLMTMGVASAYSANVFFFDNIRPAADIISENLICAPEYTTRWMERDGLDFQIHLPEAYKHVEPAHISEGEGQATLVSQTSRRITLHADITSPHATILIKRLYFPGWETSDPTVTIHESKVLLAVDVPSGSHDIVLKFPWYDGEKTGTIISILALGLLIGWSVILRRSQDASP